MRRKSFAAVLMALVATSGCGSDGPGAPSGPTTGGPGITMPTTPTTPTVPDVAALYDGDVTGRDWGSLSGRLRRTREVYLCEVIVQEMDGVHLLYFELVGTIDADGRVSDITRAETSDDTTQRRQYLHSATVSVQDDELEIDVRLNSEQPTLISVDFQYTGTLTRTTAPRSHLAPGQPCNTHQAN